MFRLPPFVEIEGMHGSNAFGRVTNVTVDGYLTESMTAIGTFDGVPTTATFADNIVRPRTPGIPADRLAVNVVFGALAGVSGNTITGAL